jgi:hypothetical protein
MVGNAPVVLRVNVASGSSVDEVQSVVADAAAAGVSDVFVDLMYVARDVDHALELAAALLGG